jgi:3-hydroxybutyryl-CoA dehydrogenase
MAPTAPADFVLDLDFSPAPPRIAALAALSAPLILVNAVSTPLHTFSADPRFVRINAWNTFLQRPLAEVVAHPDLTDTVTAFCATWGKTPEFLADTPGMPSARVVSMIINEAYLAWGEGVSTREAIDVAMRLGTNYPLGPFDWGAQIGLPHVCELLEALGHDNPLYTIAPRLREEALAHGPVA